jgi:hypothetical protein
VTTREQLLQEISNAPDFLIEEVLDFLLFAKTRRQQSVSVTEPVPASVQPSKPIWEVFEEFADQLPESIASTLPTDGAAQLDHYLYGSPKRDE